MNLLCRGKYYDETKPNLLLNAHMDTVKPVSGWTMDPYKPVIKDGKIYGLGSNDDGAGLVSLLYTFYNLDKKGQPYNPIFLATVEEEKSGPGGMKLAVDKLPPIEVAIIGEPTGMRPAIAEKGLLVLDFCVHGKSGHAARNEGINAINRATDVIFNATKLINELNTLTKENLNKRSKLLGPLKFSITMIQAGTQHNVIPDSCRFTADVRTNEHYSNKKVLEYIQKQLPDYCEVKARSLNLNSSRIKRTHPIIVKAKSMKLRPYGSPTLSDQAILKCQSLKLGPGNSARSHTADEYVTIDEFKGAVPRYMELLDGLNIMDKKSVIPTRIAGVSVTNCKNHLNTSQKRRK